MVKGRRGGKLRLKRCGNDTLPNVVSTVSALVSLEPKRHSTEGEDSPPGLYSDACASAVHDIYLYHCGSSQVIVGLSTREMGEIMII